MAQLISSNTQQNANQQKVHSQSLYFRYASFPIRILLLQITKILQCSPVHLPLLPSKPPWWHSSPSDNSFMESYHHSSSYQCWEPRTGQMNWPSLSPPSLTSWWTLNHRYNHSLRHSKPKAIILKLNWVTNDALIDSFQTWHRINLNACPLCHHRIINRWAPRSQKLTAV